MKRIHVNDRTLEDTGMHRGISIVVGAVVVGLAVSGCATATTTAGSTSSPSVTRTATPSPTPTSTLTQAPTPTPTPTDGTATAVNDPADPSTWVITQDAVGPIVVGQAGPAESATPAFVAEPCSGTGTTWFTRQGKTGLVTQAPDGVVALVGVVGDDLASSPRTAAGIGVGSTEDEFLATYPDAVPKDLDNGNYGSTWTVAVGPGRIAFNVPAGGSTVQTIIPGDSVPTEYCG